MAEQNDKSAKAVLSQNPLQWVIVDNSAHVKYIVIFTLCNLRNGELKQNSVQLSPDSVQHFEWTNEANNLYLTGKLIVSDVGNIMPQFYNTFTGLHVSIEKQKHIPKQQDNTVLNKFEHDFLFDKMTIENQQVRQTSNNHVLVYNITLKSIHAMKLFAHGEFSNWNSGELTAGNYTPTTEEDEIGNSSSNSGKTFAKKLAKNVAKNISGKLKSINLVSKLKDIAGTVSSTVEKLESMGINADKNNASKNPVKIYEIIQTILEKALNDESEEEEEKFKFLNFDKVFGEQHPKMKYIMTKQDNILDSVRYLQQKLFSLKLPSRLTMFSDTGLSYISYDEFEKNFKVICFKDVESFRANKNEDGIELIQVNGGTGIMRLIRRNLLKIKPPKQNRFSGMIDYFTNFYHVIDYELLEDMHSGPGKTNFSKPSEKDENIDYGEGINKILKESNEKIKFLYYSDDFDELEISGEQNTKSFGKDLFYEADEEKAEPYTHVYSEDFDNNSYIKLLNDVLFKNPVTIEFSGNFFDVPGMVFMLTLDSKAGEDGDYYSQLNNSIMHITKVTHIINKAPGSRESDGFVGEELTLCKI